MVVETVCDVLRLYVLPPGSMSRTAGSDTWSTCDSSECDGISCISEYLCFLSFSRNPWVPFLLIVLPMQLFWLLLLALFLPVASDSDDCHSVVDLTDWHLVHI